MNCQQFERELLLCQDLAVLPAELEKHLAQCPACQKWQRRLVQIEANVPLLPIPRAEAKFRLQQEILHGPTALPLPAMPGRSWSRRRLLATAAGGLTAACVMIAAGIFLGNKLFPTRGDPQPQANLPRADAGKSKDPPATTLAGKLLELDLNLAEANSPRQRIKALARLAHGLHDESKALAQVAGPKDMEVLAELFGKVVGEGLVARAKSLPAAERRQTLGPIVEQMAVTRREAEELSRKASPDVAAPLRLIAAAARAGNQELRALMEVGTP